MNLIPYPVKDIKRPLQLLRGTTQPPKSFLVFDIFSNKVCLPSVSSYPNGTAKHEIIGV